MRATSEVTGPTATSALLTTPAKLPTMPVGGPY
jgi:hypothetical protein